MRQKQVRYIYFFIFLLAFAFSCKEVDVYEKQVILPEQEWRKNQLAVIHFDIKDSTNHPLFLVVRHMQRFPYNKLMVKLSIQDKTKQEKFTMNILAPLTDSANNWNGKRMDDIYYSRIKIDQSVFLKPGEYRFVLEHLMQADPLPYLLSVGIALDQ
ncbi:MAG TPA: gliding motility lipoprotein GldH [Niabella sp.]|nr:gliding motility lipoprotein GldH [Niabella sp.]HRB94632.1 gliding motility lipoprotein GldH [Niabella sp.]